MSVLHELMVNKSCGHLLEKNKDNNGYIAGNSHNLKERWLSNQEETEEDNSSKTVNSCPQRRTDQQLQWTIVSEGM